MSRLPHSTRTNQHIRQGRHGHNKHHLKQGASDLRVYLASIDVFVGQRDHKPLPTA